VNDRRFTLRVIGVMEPRGQAVGNFDRQAYVPVSTMMRRIAKTQTVNAFAASAVSSELAAEAVEQTRFYLTRRLGDSRYFRITSQGQILDAMNQATRTLTLMLGGI